VKKLILSIVAAAAIVPAASFISTDKAAAGDYGYGHGPRCFTVWVRGHWVSDGYSKYFVPGRYVTRCR